MRPISGAVTGLQFTPLSRGQAAIPTSWSKAMARGSTLRLSEHAAPPAPLAKTSDWRTRNGYWPPSAPTATYSTWRITRSESSRSKSEPCVVTCGSGWLAWI